MVKYCGLEIRETCTGLEVCHRQYVEELLQRHPDIKTSSLTPCCGWKESFDDSASSDKTPCPDAIRRAQSMTGELLWLVVRARQELGFAISRMAQLCTSRPEDSLQIGCGGFEVSAWNGRSRVAVWAYWIGCFSR